MKINKILAMAFMLASGMTLTSCGTDFLESYPTNNLEAGGSASANSVNSLLAATYQILLFDSYANNNYEAIPVVAEIQGDDCYKGGGDAGDQLQLYNISLYQADPLHTLGGSWNIYTSGFARANAVINSAATAMETANDADAVTLTRYDAEARFLRAYYLYMLWRYFGTSPFFTQSLEPPYLAPQYSSEELYAQIMADLEIAAKDGVMPMCTNGGADMGRANRAAALMLKARVVMYANDKAKYTEVANDLATIINSGEYDLFKNFDDMWINENEFCIESIFESNQMGEGKTWSSGWQGFGTNLPAFISPNELSDPQKVFAGGWGFCPVRQSAWDMFENGDKRREASILDWGNTDKAKYGQRFQDTGLFFKKYAARIGYRKSSGDVDLNYCNNLRIFRYAETLLNYAELVIMDGVAEQQGVSAVECFNKVRSRAFGNNAHNIDNPTAQDIKNEYHYEFVGEGHRYYDLVRWGDAASVLTENDEAHNSTRTWTEKKKYLPIPQAEIDRTAGTEYPLVQNDY